MPLNIYPSIYASGSVPAGWKALPVAADKRPVRNADALRHLRSMLPGRWRKAYRFGNLGEIHYFEHDSGQVAGVKFRAYR